MLRIQIGKKMVRFMEFGHTDIVNNDHRVEPAPLRLVLVKKETYPSVLMNLVAMVKPCSNNEAKRLIKQGAIKVRQVDNDLANMVFDSAMNGVISVVNGVPK